MISESYQISSLATSAPTAVASAGSEEVDSDSRRRSEAAFLRYVYLGTVLVRLVIGGAIFFSGYLEFFAGDAVTYDTFGWELSKIWSGEAQYTQWVRSRVQNVGHNGMFYWVAAGYFVLGRSPFLMTAIQILIVSSIPVLVYKISKLIFDSDKIARYAALMTGFFPSMVIWSSMLLKDPIVTFLFCVTVLYTLKMQHDLKLRYILPALAALLLIFPMRGYVFYFALLAVVGSFLMSRFGRGASLTGYLARLAGLALIAISLFILGFDDIARQQLSVNILERVQVSRADMARRAGSGFDLGVNVSTLEGAIAYVPRGIVYLLFAPFPWDAGGLRRTLALPETLLWYGLFPFCIIGMFFTAGKHFRRALIIFLFSVQLTLFYAIFQGNVGTAHRQRTQIFVFYFIFTAAGLVHARRKSHPLGQTMPTRRISGYRA